MSSHTLVVGPSELESKKILIEGDAYRHLFRARRLAVGELLRLVDGCGSARVGRILEVERSRAWVGVGGAAPNLESTRDLTLWIAIPKMDRASWLVEKATELGVNTIAFIEFQRSNRSLAKNQMDRLARVSRAALAQCGRSRLPRLAAAEPLSEVIGKFSATTYWLDPDSQSHLAAEGPESSVGLVVGPEGGFETSERHLLKEYGVEAVGLGERILRIETAAVVASGILLCGPRTR